MTAEIRGVTKRYGKKSVLKGIDLTVREGRCIGILGGNGSGKSTFLSILAGLTKCDKGGFVSNGVDLFKDSKQRSRLVGYVPQGTPLIEELTAWDNLLLWYDKARLKRELSSGVLNMLGIDGFLRVPVGKMSGGMKKRLSIGCAISENPPLLLLDEPMAALDLVCKQNILTYLRGHKKAGGSILLVTHDMLDIELCDEWYIIKEGVLVPFFYDGSLETVVSCL